MTTLACPHCGGVGADATVAKIDATLRQVFKTLIGNGLSGIHARFESFVASIAGEPTPLTLSDVLGPARENEVSVYMDRFSMAVINNSTTHGRRGQ